MSIKKIRKLERKNVFEEDGKIYGDFSDANRLMFFYLYAGYC